VGLLAMTCWVVQGGARVNAGVRSG
jgi:hypothetical protein